MADELADLAQHGASGALRISGDPGGIVYLSDGYLTFAESAAAPDVGSRLVNSRRLLVDQWSRARRDSGPDGCAGELLLRWGLLDAAEWHFLLRSAAMDALIALAAQLAGDRSIARTSFVPQPSWPPESAATPALRMDTGPAWAYAWEEAERLAEYDILPEATPSLCGPGGGWPGLGQQAAVVLGQINGRATVRELAWRNGLALSALMDWVVRLIRGGVCIITRSAASDAPAAVAPDAGTPDAGTPQHLEGREVRWARPDLDQLRRVLAGLKRL